MCLMLGVSDTVTGTDDEAFIICSQVLEATGSAVLHGAFEPFASHFNEPTIFETFEGRRVIETKDELRRTFEAAGAFYAGLGVTDLVRHVVAAAFSAPNTVHATIECRVLAGTVLVLHPYSLHTVLEKVEDRWLISETIYIIEDAPRFTRLVSFGPRTTTSLKVEPPA